MTERRVVNWSLKLGIQRLDARSPVGRHSLIVDSVVPYSCCLTDSLNLYFSPLKRALVASIAKVKGVVQEKFSGAPPQTLSYFAPPIKNPGGATGYMFMIVISVLVIRTTTENHEYLIYKNLAFWFLEKYVLVCGVLL